MLTAKRNETKRVDGQRTKRDEEEGEEGEGLTRAALSTCERTSKKKGQKDLGERGEEKEQELDSPTKP